MLSPLAFVKTTCSMLQQEETQREVLKMPRVETEVSAMYNKGQNDKTVLCKACGKQGHAAEKCWIVAGYPKWHLKHGKMMPRISQKDQGGSSGVRWTNGKGNFPKMAANVQENTTKIDLGLLFSPQQIDQMIKLLPTLTGQQGKGSEIDDEINTQFSGTYQAIMLQALLISGLLTQELQII